MIRYLKTKPHEDKESRNDFINHSRELLIKQISIQNKVEETEKLRELITMEVEKLEDAKNSFQEDCEKFEKYMEELEYKANKAKEITDNLIERKNNKVKQINQL